MAELPIKKLDSQSYPFINVGVIYFGSFEVKLLRRTMKCWCCLITCLTNRAKHIDVVRSLDIESCLVAVNQCIARRRKPAILFSNNGTNFTGSARELKE